MTPDRQGEILFSRPYYVYTQQLVVRQGNPQGIVDLAKSSPLADVGDLSQVRKALDDPDHVLVLRGGRMTLASGVGSHPGDDQHAFDEFRS